jgi:hypothetical protein
MLFKNPVRTSKRTPYFTITKINWLTLFKFNVTRCLSHFAAHCNYLSCNCLRGLILDGGRALFVATSVSGPALGVTLPPIDWIPGALSVRTKGPEREANRSPAFSADVKNASSLMTVLQLRVFTA